MPSVAQGYGGHSFAVFVSKCCALRSFLLEAKEWKWAGSNRRRKSARIAVYKLILQNARNFCSFFKHCLGAFNNARLAVLHLLPRSENRRRDAYAKFKRKKLRAALASTHSLLLKISLHLLVVLTVYGDNGTYSA